MDTDRTAAAGLAIGLAFAVFADALAATLLTKTFVLEVHTDGAAFALFAIRS